MLYIWLAAVPQRACDGNGTNVNSYTFRQHYQTQHGGPAERSHTVMCTFTGIRHSLYLSPSHYMHRCMLLLAVTRLAVRWGQKENIGFPFKKLILMYLIDISLLLKMGTPPWKGWNTSSFVKVVYCNTIYIVLCETSTYYLSYM